MIGSRKEGGNILTSYRGLALDRFQIEAIEHILAGKSVLVSAPTGAGKTLVADYLIERVIAAGGRAIYTAPIKALSNQKYKDFKRLYGQENVGIVTGDVVINDTAQILVMTTEILRNILHTEPERLELTTHVIFDEIHYIGNEDRGSVWEEAIIFLPGHIRILGLSATIPNASDLAAWMSQARGEDVKVVRHTERPVPLAHYVFEKGMGAGTLQDLIKFHREKWEELTRPKADRRGRRRSHGEAHGEANGSEPEDPYEDYNGGWEGEGFGGFHLFPTTTHLDLIKYLTPDLLPCLYFLFSRQQCEIKAKELAARKSFLGQEAQREVAAFFDGRMGGLAIEGFPKTQALRHVLMKGVGFHHAGLLPALKEVVEDLFADRKILVLYCTETFAVGVNMPVRTVCFDSPEKFDGVSYRPMTHQEYFQMAGRAGRRGIDKQGYVFTLVDLNYFKKEKFPVHEEKRIEDLRSQFKLSYNTVLNLVAHYSEDEIRVLLDRSFAAYQRRKAASVLRDEIESVRLDRDSLRASLGLDPGGDKGESAGDKGANAGGSHTGKERRGAFKALRRLESKLASLEVTLSRLSTSGELMAEFGAKVRLLQRLEYIEPGMTLTDRGAMASRINVQELLVTELICDGLFYEFDEDQVNALAVAIDYEPRREVPVQRKPPFELDRVTSVIRLIKRAEQRELGYATVVFDPYFSELAYLWSRGMDFAELVRAARQRMFSPGAVDEGDIVSCFRRGIDLLRQIRLACAEDEAFVHKLNRCMDKMDRGVVRVDLL